MPEHMLPLVNDDDIVIGEAPRERIHREGLLHREVHVWFVTPAKEIIFQRRAKDKDTWPNLLDATVGGHVEKGMTYLDAALQETLEETGLRLASNDLVELVKVKMEFADIQTNTINNAFKMEYMYRFAGNVDSLNIEVGKGQGFETRSLASLENMSAEEKKQFLPRMFTPEFMHVFKLIKDTYA